MISIKAGMMHFQELNQIIKTANGEDIEIENCLGQRYIASGLKSGTIVINGVPGNALGAYLNGANIKVFGNAQDATGDTMSLGTIYIDGNCGDAAGYAMRGGAIYIRGDVGYRAGIHMKAYQERVPVLVIGGETGSFLGEYQAGGSIIVLGLGHSTSSINGNDSTSKSDDYVPVGNFCATGMHGGKIYIRGNVPKILPQNVLVRDATDEDLAEIEPYINNFCNAFHIDRSEINKKPIHVLTPNIHNPYKQLYTHN